MNAANKWRLFPGFRYTNYRKEFPNMGAAAFRKWFHFKRLWSGKLIYIGIRHLGRELLSNEAATRLADLG